MRLLRSATLISLAALVLTVGCKPAADAPTAATGQAAATRPTTPPAPQTSPAQRPQPAAEKLIQTIGQGEDAIPVLYLQGTPYQLGYTHGKLAADKIKAFYTTVIMAMCLGMKVPVAKLDEAWAQMEPYVSTDIKEEMRGLAAGAGVDLRTVQRVHAIPDLSEYHCTFFAAWGKATSNGHLFQIRALDYATEAGIQNYPALLVYKPAGKNPHVVAGWLGFIGCVTGINSQKIALSEIGDHYGDDKETLAGEPFPFLFRRILAEADSLDEAVRMVQQAKRTSSYLYCIGDGKIPSARALMTCKDWAYVFDPFSLPNRHLNDVVYFSMGADSPWNEKVFDVLKAHYGHIDEKVAMEDVMKGLGTGNLHAVAWDVTALKMWVANCASAPPGTAGQPAYERPFVPFDVAKALSVKSAAPTSSAP
jgi:isopenicillin-N N-acyltransferase-like protein